MLSPEVNPVTQEHRVQKARRALQALPVPLVLRVLPVPRVTLAKQLL